MNERDQAEHVYKAEAEKGAERVRTEAGERIPFTEALALAGVTFDPTVHYDPVRNEPPIEKAPPSPPTMDTLTRAKALVTTPNIENRNNGEQTTPTHTPHKYEPLLVTGKPEVCSVCGGPPNQAAHVEQLRSETRLIPFEDLKLNHPDLQAIYDAARSTDEDVDGLDRRAKRILAEVLGIVDEAKRVRDQHRAVLDHRKAPSIAPPPSLIRALRGMISRLPETVHPDPGQVLIRETWKPVNGETITVEVTIGEIREWLKRLDA